jgi:hypothetical protein
LVHYRTHVLVLNDRAYKSAPKKVIDNLKDHIMAHEYLVLTAAQKKPAILQQFLLEFPQFPMFFNDFDALDQAAPQNQAAADQLGGLLAGAQPMQQQQQAMPIPLTNEVPIGDQVPMSPAEGII